MSRRHDEQKTRAPPNVRTCHTSARGQYADTAGRWRVTAVRCNLCRRNVPRDNYHYNSGSAAARAGADTVTTITLSIARFRHTFACCYYTMFRRVNVFRAYDTIIAPVRRLVRRVRRTSTVAADVFFCCRFRSRNTRPSPGRPLGAAKRIRRVLPVVRREVFRCSSVRTQANTAAAHIPARPKPFF